MVNHLTGKSTVLTWADYDFRTKLNERDFSRTGLNLRRTLEVRLGALMPRALVYPTRAIFQK